MLRILMVTARYIPSVGGTEIHTYEVARRLANAGHDVTVLTTNLNGKLPPSETSEGVKVLRVPARPAGSDYSFAPQIYQTIKRGRWDLIHVQGYHTLTPPLAMLAARRSSTPYVITFHSGGHSSRVRNAVRWLQHALLRPGLARAEKLIGVSKYETAFFQKRLRLPPDRFVTISNGSYLPKSDGVPRSNNGTLIVSVGRLERYKGHQRIIAALPGVIQQYPDTRLSIIGSGPYGAALRHLAQQCGVTDRVQIGPIAFGARAGMASVLSQANLAVLFSDYEAQGIVVIEALSLGVPVLVTHTSGLADFADEGLARSIPLDSTPDAVAAAVVEQLRSPLVAPAIALPTWDRCATQLLDLYYGISYDRRGQGQYRTEMPNGIRDDMQADLLHASSVDRASTAA